MTPTTFLLQYFTSFEFLVYFSKRTDEELQTLAEHVGRMDYYALREFRERLAESYGRQLEEMEKNETQTE